MKIILTKSIIPRDKNNTNKKLFYFHLKGRNRVCGKYLLLREKQKLVQDVIEF